MRIVESVFVSYQKQGKLSKVVILLIAFFSVFCLCTVPAALINSSTPVETPAIARPTQALLNMIVENTAPPTVWVSSVPLFKPGPSSTNTAVLIPVAGGIRETATIGPAEVIYIPTSTIVPTIAPFLLTQTILPIPSLTRFPARAPLPTSPPPPSGGGGGGTRSGCCKICRNSQPCGNSCISWKYTCHKPPGCARNG